MAHFAEIDNDNFVRRVLVVGNEDCLDENGNESEEVGKAFLKSLFGGTWVQTSYTGSIRGKYASTGDIYDPEADVFVAPLIEEIQP